MPTQPTEERPVSTTTTIEPREPGLPTSEPPLPSLAEQRKQLELERQALAIERARAEVAIQRARVAQQHADAVSSAATREVTPENPTTKNPDAPRGFRGEEWPPRRTPAPKA